MRASAWFSTRATSFEIPHSHSSVEKRNQFILGQVNYPNLESPNTRVSTVDESCKGIQGTGPNLIKLLGAYLGA